MSWQDLIERHEASAATVAKIRGQQASRATGQRRAILRVAAPEGVIDQARRYMGECAGADGPINFGDLYVRRHDDLYHAGCDPAEGR